MAPLPIKVLVLIPTLDIGGAEMDVVRIVPRLDRTRFKIVVQPFLRQGPLADELSSKGIDVVGLSGPACADANGRSPPVDVCLSPRPRAGRARYLVHRALISRPVLMMRHAISRPVRMARESIARPLRTARTRVQELLATPRSIARISGAIAQHIQRANFDVVHAILPNSYFVGALGNALAGRRPMVMSRVSLNWYQQDSTLFRFIERQILHRRVNIAIGNSAAVLQELRAEGLPESKLRLIYNGIDAGGVADQLIDRRGARDRAGIGQGALVLSMIANLHRYKGHADLLHALALVHDRLPPGWVLLAVGRDVDGNLAVLERLAEELGLSRNVRFLGERLDVPLILSAADIHVSASHHEGFPNNTLEAMCAGLPIIATAVGGVPEQIADGKTGFLVRARNPAGLAAAIERLAGRPELRAQLGCAGRDHVARTFTIERAAASIEGIYETLFEQHRFNRAPPLPQ